MLNEIKNIRQHPGEPRRRWFFDPEIDLTVWFDPDGGIIGFQLTYGRPLDPHALTWWQAHGYFHHRVDDGENPGTLARKGTPILLPDGKIDAPWLGELFGRQSIDIDPAIVAFVQEKIGACRT